MAVLNSNAMFCVAHYLQIKLGMDSLREWYLISDFSFFTVTVRVYTQLPFREIKPHVVCVQSHLFYLGCLYC